jgi:hypothetical protein
MAELWPFKAILLPLNLNRPGVQYTNPPLFNSVASSPKQVERSKKMKAALDKKRFGPWALVTGA